MKTVCAWCSKVLIEDEAPNALVSHGICSECLNRLLGNTRPSLAEFLNSIELPVLLTDETRLIRHVNETAERTLGKFGGRLEGAFLATAIECLHAGATGECGLSAHCDGCVFRKTIRDTYLDGTPRYGEYSQHDVATAEGAKVRRFRFSTMKTGDMVLVAIEGVQDLEQPVGLRPPC